MKPKKSPQNDTRQSLYHTRLDALVNKQHSLIQLGGIINWDYLERELGQPYHETQGVPAKPVRLMAGLQYLKHIHNLSDEQLLERWVENPYWQHFCGSLFFEYDFPIDPSSMSRWRKLHGDKLEALLAASIQAGLATKTITPKSIEKINVDTTVQEKAITFPTDAKLYHRMREKLVKRAAAHGVELRQTYRRVGKAAYIECGRLFHLKHLKKAKQKLRKVKTYLRRVRNDIARKIAGNAKLIQAFEPFLAMAERLLLQHKGRGVLTWQCINILQLKPNYA